MAIASDRDGGVKVGGAGIGLGSTLGIALGSALGVIFVLGVAFIFWEALASVGGENNWGFGL